VRPRARGLSLARCLAAKSLREIETHIGRHIGTVDNVDHGPAGAQALDGPRGRRQVAAVDGRATSGIGDQQLLVNLYMVISSMAVLAMLRMVCLAS
jgi:hypothetical protein